MSTNRIREWDDVPTVETDPDEELILETRTETLRRISMRIAEWDDVPTQPMQPLPPIGDPVWWSLFRRARDAKPEGGK